MINGTCANKQQVSFLFKIQSMSLTKKKIRNKSQEEKRSKIAHNCVLAQPCPPHSIHPVGGRTSIVSLISPLPINFHRSNVENNKHGSRLLHTQYI